MAAPLDQQPLSHSSLFGQSAIGQLQRKEAWTYVQKVLNGLDGFEVLELNPGSSEDSELFGDKGFNMLATDLSNELKRITEKTTVHASMQHHISARYVDLESLNETLFNKKFDLVFSNFGGLNGASPASVKKLFQNIPSILNPGGRFIGIMMSRFCAWETIFFLLRLQFQKAFRRSASEEVYTDIYEANMKTWFYQPAQIINWSRDKFRVAGLKPVGIALPSTYLERFFSLRKNLLSILTALEKKLSNCSLFSGMADNFIIDLELR